MLLRLRSDPGPPSAPAPDDIFRVTGSRVILVVGLATSSDRTRREMQENDVRLLPRPSVKRRPAAGADVRSLFGSVYLCVECVPIRRCFLLLLKASLWSFLWTKILFIFSVTHQNTMCVSLSSRTKGGQCIPWLIKDLFSILKLTSVTLKLFLRPRKTKKNFRNFAAVPAKG